MLSEAQVNTRHHNRGDYINLYNNNNNNNNINKLLWRQYHAKESSSVAHLVEGMDKLTVRVQCKVHQQ